MKTLSQIGDFNMSIGDITAGIGGMFGSAAVLAGLGGKGGDKYYKMAMQLYEKINTPTFDARELQPEELQMVKEMFPEVYEAKIPQDVKTAMDSPEMRNAQVTGVNKLERIAEQGMPLEDRMAAQQAEQSMVEGAGRTQQNILRDLAARGQLSGGMEMQARLSGQQQAANMGSQMGTDLARQSALRSLQAGTDLTQAAGNVRAQDVNVSGQQADAINRFNEMQAQMQNAQAQYAAGARERAQGYNTQTQQGLADQNAQTRMTYAQQNQARTNALRQQQYDNEMKKANAQSGAYNQYGLVKDQNKAAREQNIMGIGQSLGKTIGGVGSLFAGGIV